MLKTKTVTTASPMPIYAGAAVFAVFALVFPMIKISTILLGLGISLACVFVLKRLKIFPDITETVTYEEPEFFASKAV